MATASTLERSTSSPSLAAGAEPCFCCGDVSWRPKFRILKECRNCGFISADMTVSHDEIKALYQEEYFQGKEYDNYLDDKESHQKNFARRFEMMKGIAPDVKSLFEVGCAYGFWLEYCSQQGLACAGVDVCREAVDYAANVLKQTATAEDFLTQSFGSRRYDAVCMWDTIEHLAAPDKFVARASELLEPGGWLFLTTGDIGARAARWRGSRWRMIHPPTHLQYFAVPTMDRFLRRHGFTPVSWLTQPMYRSIREVLGRVHHLGKGPSRWTAGFLSKIVPGFVQKRGFWLDLGDIMFVAARKS